MRKPRLKFRRLSRPMSVILAVVLGIFLSPLGAYLMILSTGPQAIDYVPGYRVFRAAKRADWKEVRRRLNPGACPNFQDERGKTTLSIVVAIGPLDVGHLLLARGANPIKVTSETGEPVTTYRTLLQEAQSRPDGQDKAAIIRMLNQAAQAKQAGR